MVYTTYKNGGFGDGVFFIAFTSLISKIIEQSSLCYLPLLRHNLFINPPLLKPVPDAPPTNVSNRIFYRVKLNLVGGIPTPLKNMKNMKVQLG